MKIKRFTTMMIAGMLALPVMARASEAELAKRVQDLEDRLGSMEESTEVWNHSARFDWAGDFRFRTDNVSADVPSAYTALEVAKGIRDFYDMNDAFAGAAAGFAPSTFGATIGDILASFGAGTPQGTCDGTCMNDMGAAFGALTPTQAATMNTMLPMLQSGMTLGQLATAFGQTFADRSNARPVAEFMKNSFTAAQRKAIFAALGRQPSPESTYKNDTIYTNRLRLNMRVKAMEHLEFKARLAMYKIWGMQNNAVDYYENNGNGGGPFMLSSLAFDGSATRQPQDSILRVDRAFMNWNAIGDSPFWFSIGRRPVTDGPPAHLREGLDSKLATPVAYMDYAFDGATIGYAYNNLFGMEDAPGRIRFCYGRGFEAGPSDGDGLNDVDMSGISWDVYSKGDRFFYIQSFGAFNMFNVPDNVTFVNPLEYAMYIDHKDLIDPLDSTKDMVLNRANLGNIYHTSTIYMSKVNNLNYFLALGWSETDPKGFDELGNSLLSSWWDEPTKHDGYSAYVGVRYDMDDLGLKLGAEYNWGSEYWIAFTPGHDDLYASKLATRGNVFELYTIYDVHAGEAISKYSKAFIRLGYQHYQYDYTGSGFWLGAPQKTDELAMDPLSAQFYLPVDSMDQVYASIEAWF